MRITQNSVLAPASSRVEPPADKTGKEQFLELLVAQISHQDPLNPMDDKDMVTQLAQFTSVEQAIESNRRLSALEGAITGQTHTTLMNIIGKNIEAHGDYVHLDGSGLPSHVSFALKGPAQHVNVSIIDANGRLVSSWDAGAMEAGMRSVSWSGRGPHGQALPPGDYQVHIKATDGQDKAVPADSNISGVVSGLAFGPTGPELLVGGARVRTADIIQIK